jgi:hypothetical protein
MNIFKPLAAVTLLSGLLWAGAVPPVINYQGTIKQQGVPVNGTLPVSFRLTNSDGTQVYWSGPQITVTVNQGMFSTQLAPTGVDWQNVIPYIEMSVNGQTMLPREPVGTDAYAYMSQGVIDGAITTASIALGAVNTANIANGAVTSTQLAAGAVTSAAIANGAVVTAGLGPQAVTAANIANGAVTNAAIAPGSVSAADLAADATGITVPSGLIAMFSGGCPNGWTRFAALDGSFPMGSPNYGTTGGSATAPTGRGVVFGSGQGSGSFQTSWMNGDLTLANQPVSILPPYLTVIYCQKN